MGFAKASGGRVSRRRQTAKASKTRLKKFRNTGGERIMSFRSCLTPRVSNIPHQSIGVDAAKAGNQARIESLRSFQLALLDQDAPPGEPFYQAAFVRQNSKSDPKFPHR